MTTCAECGTALEEGRSCRDYFHDLLGLEWLVPGGPGLLPHFLAVTSYNLQHPSQFQPAALLGMRTALADALAGRATVPELRQRAGRTNQGATRVTRQSGRDAMNDGVPAGWPSTWPMTVREVCTVPPADYVDHVRAWAASVSSTLESVLSAR